MESVSKSEAMLSGESCGYAVTMPLSSLVLSGGALVAHPFASEGGLRATAGAESRALAADDEPTLTSSADSIWRLDTPCGRTYSGRVDGIADAEGARVRTRIAAITHELLGWAQSRLCEESEKDDLHT